MRTITTERQYFRGSLWTPLAVPVLASLVAPLFGRPGQGIAFVLLVSLVLSIVPYVIVALGVLRWSRNRSTRALSRMSWGMPLLMAVTFLLLFVGGTCAAKRFRCDRDLLTSYDDFVPVILAFGYAYVVLVQAVGWYLRRSGRMARNEADS